MNAQVSTFKSIALATAVLFSIVSCSKKDKTEPPAEQPPVYTGTLLTYTNIPATEFDKIEVIVDGKVMGTITAPYIARPECGAQPSTINTAIKLGPGKHSVAAVQYKNGKKVGEWDAEDETILIDVCTRINWAD